MLIAAAQTASAQNWQKRVSIVSGREKTVPGFGMRIKFLEVLDDSRCPVGTTCIWAGNAKVKIQVFAGRRAATFELNSTVSPRTVTIGGYEIKLDSLEPRPRAGSSGRQSPYTAVFAIRRT